MGKLLDAYEEMQKTATEENVVEETKAEEQAEVDERVETLAKYATVADELLTKEHGDDYAEDDVTKLAILLLEHDMEQEQLMEKVAEYEEAGQIMARAFAKELDDLSSKKEETEKSE